MTPITICVSKKALISMWVKFANISPTNGCELLKNMRSCTHCVFNLGGGARGRATAAGSTDTKSYFSSCVIVDIRAALKSLLRHSFHFTVAELTIFHKSQNFIQSRARKSSGCAKEREKIKHLHLAAHSRLQHKGNTARGLSSCIIPLYQLITFPEMFTAGFIYHNINIWMPKKKHIYV